MNPPITPFVCDLTRLTDEQRTRLIAVSAHVFGAAVEVRVLHNGFALAFRDASAELISKMTEFIAYDRLCCAFLEHGMVSEAGGGPTWLNISGPEGAREVIAPDLQRLISADAIVVGDLESVATR
jgi:hypothetical protein